MDKAYTLRHWILTLVISFFLVFIYAVYSWDIILGIFIAMHGLFFLLISSLSTLLVCQLLLYVLQKKHINPLCTKFTLIATTFLGIIITFQFFKNTSEIFTYSYAAVSVIVGSVLNIEKPKLDTKQE